MEQDSKPRNNPPHLWSINLSQKKQRMYSGEKTASFLLSGAGKTGQSHVKE